MGLIGSLNYTRKVGRWDLSLGGNYNQNAQTLLITYTTNYYGYAASVSRKFHNTSRWTVLASGSNTSLVGQGAGSSNQTYSGAISLRKFSASAGYSHSSGNGVITATGITNTSVLLPIITPTSLILYGGDSYFASFGATPFRGLTLSASYARSLSNTEGNSVSSTNRNETLNARVQYLIRKIYFQAGYLRLEQGFSQSGVAAINTSSVYVGLQRWFNFF